MGSFLRKLLGLHPDSQPVFEDGHELMEVFQMDASSEPEEDVEEAGLEPKEELEKGELGPEEAEEETLGSSLKRKFEEDYEELPIAKPSSKKAHSALQARLNRVKPTFVIQTGGFANMASYYPEMEENWKEVDRLSRKLRARDDDVLIELVDGRLKPMKELVKEAISGLHTTGFSLYVCMYVYGRAFCCAWS